MNNNDYNINLYNSVWNNKYLKTIILYNLKILNIFNNITFYNNGEWEKFKFKHLLYNVTFDFKFSLKSIPSNIKHVNIQPLENPNEIIKLPSSIESVGLLFLSSLYLDSPFFNSLVLTANSKVNLLCLFSGNNLPFIKPKSFPPSITNLELKCTLRQKLNSEIIPRKVKTLVVHDIKNCDRNFFPESLTDIKLFNSIPNIVNQLPTSGNLTKLTLKSYNKTLIEFDSSIKFPNSLKYLDVHCSTFNTSLPENLKTFRLSIKSFMFEINFPSLLEDLRISANTTQFESISNVFKGHVLHNLKSLYLDFCNKSLIDSEGNSAIPKKVEYLTLNSFNYELMPNHLPPNLKELTLGSIFNHYIEENVLPSSLQSLSFGRGYYHKINPSSIPSNLKKLEILSSDYYNPINLNNPNTVIFCENLISYYNPIMESNETLKVLKLPSMFTDPLSSLQLQNKSSLHYLHLGSAFNKEILKSDLPISNNIKTLVLSYRFNKTINLELFQNLKYIILQDHSICIITTTKDNNNNYNYYSLKNIITSTNNILKYLDPGFYKFLKFKQSSILH